MSGRGARDLKPDQKKCRPAPSRAPQPVLPWSVPVQVAEIPQTGRHIEITPDAATRDAVAKAVGVLALDQLKAAFDLAPAANDGVRVSGVVSASAQQTCVVTLDPMATQIEEVIDLMFMPPGATVPQQQTDLSGATDEGDPPEILQNDIVDLGAVATEFLVLGIDPYPRMPGASFEAPAPADAKAHPFAALGALKKDPGAKQR